MKTIRTSVALLFYFSLIFLTSCSTLETYHPTSSSTTNVILPVIPEIKRPKVKVVSKTPSKPNIVIRSKTVQVAKVKPAKPTKKVRVVTAKQLEEKKRLKEEAKKLAIKNSTINIDPFSTIPDSSSSSASVVKSNRPTSAAVKSLLISARADLALNRNRSAVSKLERGLRIEPQNPTVWHMLAKAHFNNSAYLHSISMAKKSNSNTQDRQLINENWKLIKAAGERSGNATEIKEALDYIKLNP